jgi:protein-S-isoprenylcysteine O-methyltransferase Ste14
VVLGTLGFGLLLMFFRVKTQYKTKFGDLAYSKAMSRFGFPALGIFISVVMRMGYIPGPVIPHLWGYPVLPVLGGLLVAAGLLLFVRSVQALGVDSLTMLYVYFPGEGRLADSKIYAIMRHPIYGAVQTVGLGLAALNGTWFALTLALIFMPGMWAWVHFCEEKELLERFGPPMPIIAGVCRLSGPPGGTWVGSSNSW